MGAELGADLIAVGVVDLIEDPQGLRRSRIPPDRLGQAIGADDLTAMQRQNGQHRLAPQPMHRPRLTPDHDVNRPKKTYPHDIPVRTVGPHEMTKL